MGIFRTSNPAFGAQSFEELSRSQYGGGSGSFGLAARMTIDGTVNKIGILFVCATATAGFTWLRFMQDQDAGAVMPWLLTGCIGGFVVALLTIFNKSWAPVTAPIYALLEGLALGGISAIVELRYPGIAIQAVGLTFSVLFVMLFLYRARVIQATQRLWMGVTAATCGIALFYLVQMLLSAFGVNLFYGPNGVNGSGAIGIGFSLLVV